MNRREFLRNVGGGLVVLLWTRDLGLAQESGRTGSGRGRPARPTALSAWLHIAEDGTITVFTGKVEVGQNTRTTLTQIVAEELRVPVASIQLVMGDTDRVPWDAGTFGSRSTPDMGTQLRRVAASAREALIELAVAKLGVSRESLVIEAGKISRSGSGESVTFGELARGQAILREIKEDATTTPAAQWRVAGTSIPKVNGRAFVTGAHRYTSDLKLPGMLHGKVLRAPTLGSSLATVDVAAAESMPQVVVAREGNFVGVAAPNPHLAEQAIAAIRAEWKTEPQPSDRELFELLCTSSKTNLASDESAAGEKVLRRTFTVAYIAHAPLEPRAAVAEWKEGRLTVWTGTQRPFGVRGELAEAFGLSEEKVRVIVPDTGSGYGGKHTGEAAVEAARLAKAAGKPVKLVWSREEEFTWAYFRPAGVIDVSGAVRPDGIVTSWDFHNYNSGGAAIRPPYAISGAKTAYHPARSPLRQGSYRGLAATANHFAREVFMDELALAAGVEPLAFRLKNTTDQRLRAVLTATAERFGWEKSSPPNGHGCGIAAGFDKGGYVATCAEVAVDRAKDAIRVVRVVAGFECGAIVNPKHLENQVEGSIVQGLGGALFEAIGFENGRIRNARFSDYQVPRFANMPRLEIVLLDRKDLPSAGAGEAPIVGVAPALANAIFAATGIRLRALPLVPNGLKALG